MKRAGRETSGARHREIGEPRIERAAGCQRLQPGAKLQGIEIAVEGIEDMHIDGDGALVLETALGPVRMPAPPSWEEGPAGERRPIACRFILLGQDRFGFATPERRPGWAMVVDPGLVWSTFLGGRGLDLIETIAVDAQGAVTVAGYTYSTNFPATAGAFDTTYNGSSDAFASRLSPDGSKLIWSTFLGGTGTDLVRALALDAQGAVTVAGQTTSVNFPTTAGAFDTTFNGSYADAFVARLSPSGSSLLYSTFLGGTDDEGVVTLALDPQGAATVAGYTWSANFPTTAGAFDTTYNGGQYDAFVTRLSPKGSSLVYSTFLGGQYLDQANAVAVDLQGNATVTGGTSSRDFPTTAGAYDGTYNGSYDVFVARLSPKGSSLVYSTFLGSGSDDFVRAVVLDAQGVATLVGSTRSVNFPTTPGAFDTTFNGGFGDGFVARLSASGTKLEYSTFFGGAGTDSLYALAVDARGAATVAGYTASADFPTTRGAYDTTFNGTVNSGDPFVARLSPLGAKLEYSTFLGGASLDRAFALAVDERGAATVAGQTLSTSFPTTPGAYDTTHNGGSDAFVTRLDMLPTGVSRYGQSTPACRGPIAMGVTRMPQSGDPQFAVTCGSAPPVSAGVLVLGAGQDASGSPILGIRLHVDPRKPLILLPATTSTIGAAESPLPIPPGTKGARFFLQYAWANTASCGGLGKLSASDALDVTVQ